ncbi:MAG: hypothetical protein JWR07_4596 [Nevskia sp.]|nr:hypothetical protein [Nevskia sp.]
MKQFALTVVGGVMLAAGMTGCADMTVAPPMTIPDSLKVPDGQVLMMKTQASGFQIYQCKALDAAKYEWTLVAPEATLYDASGNQVGKHYAGPSWETLDGSKVVGEVKAKDPGTDATAIPWLLLAAKSHSGDGIFSSVTYVQRLFTVAGKAPPDGCDGGHVGAELRVAYKAAYYFYVVRPAAGL